MRRDIQKVYDDIAINAFKNYTILRENDSGQMEVFRLAEIEIYMKDKKNDIDDIFRHQSEKSEVQKQKEKEYVHYSGFDICLGDEKEIYCGILVRGIMNDNETIYGPGRVKYNFKNKEKKLRKIIVDYKNEYEMNLFFSDDIDKHNDFKNVVFKLPRVNLSNKISSEHLEKDLENLNMYLNLKVRYIRLKDEKFHKLGKFSPEEPREIFNALIKYKQKIINE